MQVPQPRTPSELVYDWGWTGELILERHRARSECKAAMPRERIYVDPLIGIEYNNVVRCGGRQAYSPAESSTPHHRPILIHGGEGVGYGSDQVLALFLSRYRR